MQKPEQAGIKVDLDPRLALEVEREGDRQRAGRLGIVVAGQDPDDNPPVPLPQHVDNPQHRARRGQFHLLVARVHIEGMPARRGPGRGVVGVSRVAEEQGDGRVRRRGLRHDRAGRASKRSAISRS